MGGGDRLDRLEARVDRIEIAAAEAAQAAVVVAQIASKLHRQLMGVHAVAADLAMAATHLEETLRRFA